MNQEQRLELVTKGTVEIIQPAELERVLEEKKKPRAYWGFECSGKQLVTATWNDAYRHRTRLRLENQRHGPSRIPLHHIPSRLAQHDKQQVRRRHGKDRDSWRILQTLFHSTRTDRRQSRIHLGLRTRRQTQLLGTSHQSGQNNYGTTSDESTAYTGPGPENPRRRSRYPILSMHASRRHIRDEPRRGLCRNRPEKGPRASTRSGRKTAMGKAGGTPHSNANGPCWDTGIRQGIL